MISIPHIFWNNPVSLKNNVIQFDVDKQIAQTIHLEQSVSDDREIPTFYENVFNGARCLKCHCGCCSMKQCGSLVGPIRNHDNMTCSLLDFLKANPYSPKVGWIWTSSFWMLLFQLSCHLGNG